MIYIQETIDQLNQRLARGETTREALVSGALEAAAQPAAKSVFTKLYPEAALAAARAADAAQKAGVVQPALAGLPVSIKDLYGVAGETTMAGSIVCQGEPPQKQDAPVVARLRSAGAAIVGKTNMTEFAFSGIGINPHYGTPVNPSDSNVARIPGGSSSGAGVSVALGLSVAGLGSDTGGSIRIPAALCGIVGFKSTQNRVPLEGALELSRSLDTVCAMTRSVQDCITVDAVLSGAMLPVRRRPLTGMRLAVPQTVVLDGLDKTVSQAFDRSLSILSEAGAQIIEIALTEFADIPKVNSPGGLSPIEAYAVHHERLARAQAQFDQRVAARVMMGASVTAQQYIALLDKRRAWIASVERAMEGYDALLCPTVPAVAPEIEKLVASDEVFFKANGQMLRNTFIINLLDGCSYSLPCHRDDELPVGLMLSSVHGDDARLSAVALAVEDALRAHR
ncbi:amidase [Zwartia panacis]|uniref:amidase n=1 Tax=Zwartia panacis TaxID=2683345 RepID=UPI0025B34E27|nr:amidase [Zwartia panacis]MDN4015923.1 amidase [Zwartia panacis]